MNKKMISLTLAAMMTLGAVPAYASIADENIIWHGQVNTETGETTVLVDNTTPAPTYTALPNNEIRVVVNGKELSARGVSIDGRTLVPLRALGEALGATVNWDANKQEIRIEKMLYNSNSKGIVTESNRVILMSIGSKQVLKNGTAEELDVAPQIIGGSTMVPVRAVTDFLEATIDWDETSRTVQVQPSMATSINGAVIEQQNQQIDFGNAVANRVEEINRLAEIEKEQYKAENRPKGEMKAWGFVVSNILITKSAQEFVFSIDALGSYADQSSVVEDHEFRLNIIDKQNGQTEYTKDFWYKDLEDWGWYDKNLKLPTQYLDKERFEYVFSVIVE